MSRFKPPLRTCPNAWRFFVSFVSSSFRDSVLVLSAPETSQGRGWGSGRDRLLKVWAVAKHPNLWHTGTTWGILPQLGGVRERGMKREGKPQQRTRAAT